MWRYEVDGFVLEKRLFLPYGQNTVHVTYRLLSGNGSLRLGLRPAIHFRSHDAPVSGGDSHKYVLTASSTISSRFPPEAICLLCGFRSPGRRSAFTFDRRETATIPYPTEKSRGYEWQGSLWSPGYFRSDLAEGDSTTLVASTESWETIRALTPEEACRAELDRRRLLLAAAPPASADGRRRRTGARRRSVPHHAGRPRRGRGARPRRGRRDPHRHRRLPLVHRLGPRHHDQPRRPDAGHRPHQRSRLDPAHLRPLRPRRPDPQPVSRRRASEGLYHTADATLWFFHAIHRYVELTGDRTTLRLLLPKLRRHRRPPSCAARASASASTPPTVCCGRAQEGYQLTWMDAKVDDWVVTPRRGKAVEINALWYNALRLLEEWLREEEGDAQARHVGEARRPRPRVVQRAVLVRGGRLPLRRRRRARTAATTPPAAPTRCSPSRWTIRCSTERAGKPVLDVVTRAAADARRPALARARPSRLQGRSTTAICARATRPIIRARSGPG